MRISSPFILSLLGSTMLFCASAHAETLSDAVSMALQTHPTIEAAMAMEKKLDEERKAERSGLFPTLNANATSGRIFGDNSTSRGLTVNRGEAYSYLWEGTASVTQPIFDGMETFNRIDAAKARMEAQNLTVSDVKQNLGLRAVQAYAGVLRAREALEKVENYQDTLKAYQDRIRMMVDQGAADEAEAAQAKNISLLLQDSLADFGGQVEQALADYIEIVGRAPESELEQPVMQTNLSESDVDVLVEYAKDSHPSMQAARKQLESYAYSTEAQEGTLYPDLNAELSALKRDQKEEIGGEVRDGRALLRLSWAFETGGGDLARIRKTKAEYSEALANMQASQREIIRDVRKAYAAYNTAREQRKLIEEREKITAGLFETYKVQFEGSRVTLLQLMQAENQMFNTQLEAINLKYEEMAAYYTLMASMGDLLKDLKLDESAPSETQTDVYPKEQSSVSVEEEQSETLIPADDMADDKTQLTEDMTLLEDNSAAEQEAEPELAKQIAQPTAEPALKPATQTQPELVEVSDPVYPDILTEETVSKPKEQIYPLEDYEKKEEIIWQDTSGRVYP